MVLIQDGLIEVGYCRRGRPGYRWVQGWSIDYGNGRKSMPMRYRDARAFLKQEKENAK